MFNITNSRDFYLKALDDFESLLSNTAYAGFAMNCAFSSYHLAEWIWGDWLKTDFATWKKLGIRDLDGFKGWVEAQCRYFKTVQDVANGSKHFSQALAGSTHIIETAKEIEGQEYEENHLVVEVAPQELRSFEDIVEELMVFWHSFMVEHSPYKTLRSPADVHAEW